MKRLIKENHAVKNKYVAAFDYINKILIVLSATTGTASACSFTGIVGTPVRIAGAKNHLVQEEKKNKKDDKILMLAKSKLNSIETLISQAL